MISLRRMFDAWKASVAEDSLVVVRAALAGPIDDVLAERVCRAAIVDPELVRTTLGPVAASVSSAQLAGAELLNALACTGASVEIRLNSAEQPGSARGQLVALAVGGGEVQRLPQPTTLAARLDGIDAIAQHLVTVARGDRDANAALAGWHAIVTACQRGQAGASLVLLVARVVVHEIGGQPLESVARWVNDTLERQARFQEHSLAETREQARTELLDNAERLAARPEQRLRAWEQAAVPIAALVDRPLDELSRELSRTVLVTPRQDGSAARSIIDRLHEVAPTTPEEQLAVCDAINALACAGVDVPASLHERVIAWLPALANAGPPLSARLRAGLAALAYSKIDLAQRVAPERRGDFVGGLAVSNDMVSLVGYVIAAVRVGAVSATLDNALHGVGEELDQLCQTEQLDEATLLWLARVVFHDLDRQPLGEVALRAHDWLWRIPRDLEQARHEATTRAPAEPIGHTLAGGKYRIDQWLMGTGAQRLYRGVETASNQRVLISFDEHSPRHNIDELRNAVSYRVPGSFELAHVGPLDQDRHHWAIVERVSPGEWLPRVLGPADPWSAEAKAIGLGLSAGRILERAAEGGVILAQVRPELMWAERTADGLRVTGLSARAIELFQRSKGEQRSHRLFDRWYRDPEAARNPDERAVVFALAVMIAEWATGRHPLRDTGDHDPIETSAALRVVLERALRAKREERPSLREFLVELGKLGPEPGA